MAGARGDKPHLRQRGPRSFGLSYRNEAGRRTEMVIHARTRSEARKLADEFLYTVHERIRLGLPPQNSQATLDETWEGYSKIAERLSSFNSKESRYRLHIRPALGGKKLHAIRPSDIDALLGAKLKEGYAPQQVKHLRNDLSAMFKWAIRKARTYRGDNPVGFAEQIDVPDPEPKALSNEQLQAVLEQCSDDSRLLVRTAALTGMRKGELLGLRWANVDLVRRLIWVERSYAGKTKSKKPRPVPIHPSLFAHLFEAAKVATSAFVFPGPDGLMRNVNFDAADMFRRALGRAGIVSGYRLTCRRRTCRFKTEAKESRSADCPKCGFRLWVSAIPAAFTFKDLRSTFATHLVEQTGNLRAAQLFLGHASQDTTDRSYARRQVPFMSQQMERLQLLGDGLESANKLPTATGNQQPQSTASSANHTQQSEQ